MSTVLERPVFESVGAPVSVLVDFDGTISLDDVGDELLARHAPDQADVADLDRRYDAGLIGSRALIAWDMEVLGHDLERLLVEVEAMPIDASFAELVAYVRSIGGAIEIVSDGIGFHIEPMLRRAGLADLPVATNRVAPGAGGAEVTFPFGHPQCHVCGTCKRERVRLHQAAGRAVVFVGDGTSDRYAANHADVVFAKGSLAEWCERAGIEMRSWERLADVRAWLAAALASGRLPATEAAFPAWLQRFRQHRAFICGPEAAPPRNTRVRMLS